MVHIVSKDFLKEKSTHKHGMFFSTLPNKIRILENMFWLWTATSLILLIGFIILSIWLLYVFFKKHRKIATLIYIFVLISTFCLGFIKYNQEQKKQYQIQWFNYLEDETINGIKNPYFTDELIYKYHATNTDRRGSGSYCSFDVFSIKAVENTKINLKYLNQYIENLNISNKRHSKYILKNNVIFFDKKKNVFYYFTNWIKNSDVSKKFPNIYTKLSDGKIKKSAIYDQYSQCINFLKNKDAFIQTYVEQNTNGFKKYGATFTKKMKYHDNTKIDGMHLAVIDIVYNPNTYTKIKLTETNGTIYFYNAQTKYFIVLKFGI